MAIRFGPAGNETAFYDAGHKHSYEMPQYLAEMGLGAYEYQCGRGVNLGEAAAEKIRQEAERCGVAMSLHAPYFISLSTSEQEKADKNIGYITASARAVRLLGGQRVVVHSGSCAKITREQALALSIENLRRAQRELDELDLSEVILCPETMGKINQLGTLEEVLALCGVDERMLPCIDFGHLNARTLGGVQTKEDFARIFDIAENAIGRDRTARFHSHFSKIEYSKGGEVRHLTFEDTVFGPCFEPLAEVIAQRGYTPTIICESAGTQAQDALSMQKAYEAACRS